MRAGAQSPHRPDATIRSVQGTITRATGKTGRPLAGAWVTLHRVGADTAGALDSVRTGAAGHFGFSYHVRGDSNALYFVSSRYAGIAYFSPPLRKPSVENGDADLVLYDTTSTPVPIHVRGRHIVVMAPDSTRRRPVIEAYEISNDSTVTRVAGVAGRPTFEAVLPNDALDPRATDGDVSADAVRFSHGRAQLFAALAPGIKQLAFRYHLAPNDRPVAIPSLAPVSVLEVLVEGSVATVSGAGLVELEPTVLDGRRFRRFLSQDSPANSVIFVTVPRQGPARQLGIATIIGIICATMLLALGVSFMRRAPSIARARRLASDDPEALARGLVALETSFANLESPTAAQRADHYEARARVTARRLAALARLGEG